VILDYDLFISADGAGGLEGGGGNTRIVILDDDLFIVVDGAGALEG